MMESPILSVNQLSIIDSDTNDVLIHHCDFNVFRGRTLAIIGESGSGKSITSKALLCLNDSNLVATGQVMFDGINLLEAPFSYIRKIRGKKIAMIMQQGATAFDPSSVIWRQLYETMHVHTSMSKYKIREVLLRKMTQLSLNEPERILNAYPHELSGGMLQRVMIALALALEPDIIIADEPTTALDTLTQYDVLEQFNEIQALSNVGVIFISHDLAVVKKVADDIVVMKDGDIIETGTVNEVLQNPKHDYTRYLISSRAQITEQFQHIIRGEDDVEH
ncbi:ABC transporter ATP-binding protein [Mammaliicoccus stepanovicii]|uniref:Oligopeptide transporter putative ATPase domain protein n=2 Tax=Mammaliicoccus stepanovicii TaxID=643214 RepID=A0A239Z2D5_9STAP|nr:ABC transporter ATP-binding protein [Mammaliicoccus stepanovicii]GGI40261.1 ABC transporter ATP-binding protein [Mammaliicoccus stepanovicii]SNV65157.1 Oligopeptide transporter putative ATPase domain protein [Mammaliicoccus stepanovicii]